jgi:hypothetical protein
MALRTGGRPCHRLGIRRLLVLGGSWLGTSRLAEDLVELRLLTAEIAASCMSSGLSWPGCPRRRKPVG